MCLEAFISLSSCWVFQWAHVWGMTMCLCLRIHLWNFRSWWVWGAGKVAGSVGECVFWQCPLLKWRHISRFTICPGSIRIARGCGNWCVFCGKKNNKKLLCLFPWKAWLCSLSEGIGYRWFGKEIFPLWRLSGIGESENLFTWVKMPN